MRDDPQSHLEPGETLRFHSGLSRQGFLLRIIFVPILLLVSVTIVEIVLTILFGSHVPMALIMGFVGCVLCIGIFIQARRWEILLTDRRLLYRTRSQRSDVVQVNLSDIKRIERLGTPVTLSFRLHMRDASPIDLPAIRGDDKLWSLISGITKVDDSKKRRKGFYYYTLCISLILMMFMLAGLGIGFLLFIILSNLPITDPTISVIVVVLTLFVPLFAGLVVGVYLAPVYTLRLLKSQIGAEEAKDFIARNVNLSSDRLIHRLARRPLPYYEKALSRIYGKPVLFRRLQNGA